MRHGGSIPVAVAPENGRATPRTTASACGFRGPTQIAMRDLVFPLQCRTFPEAMASFPDQSGRVNSLKQIDIHSGTRRHATPVIERVSSLDQHH
jgi:hypothetical protein